MFMPDFSYIVRDGVLVIYDDNLGGCSVTNGAEAVIEQIRRENPGALSLPVIYRDSAGVYDELVVEYGAFKGFGDLCVTSEDTAIEMVTC